MPAQMVIKFEADTRQLRSLCALKDVIGVFKRVCRKARLLGIPTVMVDGFGRTKASVLKEVGEITRVYLRAFCDRNVSVAC